MSSESMSATSLPDVAKEISSHVLPRITYVGMDNIAIPMTILGVNGEHLASKAKANVAVSLDNTSAKGIHMSRLYNLLQQHLSQKTLSTSALMCLMDELVASQEGLSQHAKLELIFDLTVHRPALISQASGYQDYPTKLTTVKTREACHTELHISVPYSSTCPCSASLSRSALADAFAHQFEGRAINVSSIRDWLASKQASIATAHAQRSFAHLTLKMVNQDIPNFIEIIDLVEETLGTPLQTAVKRDDEQAFAKRNAENLMFVEDAVRRLHSSLIHYPKATYFYVKVEHQESLHAHDAVAEVSGMVE